jgi:hypothetical protein
LTAGLWNELYAKTVNVEGVNVENILAFPEMQKCIRTANGIRAARQEFFEAIGYEECQCLTCTIGRYLNEGVL